MLQLLGLEFDDENGEYEFEIVIVCEGRKRNYESKQMGRMSTCLFGSTNQGVSYGSFGCNLHFTPFE